jgi:hypothetical protein
VQVPLEVLFGTGGALGLALLWIYDLRRERDALKDRLYRLLDKIDVAPKPEPK